MKGGSGWIHDNSNDAPCADATEASDYTEQDYSDVSADDTNLDENYDDGKSGTEKVTSNNHKILPEQTPRRPQPMAYPPFDEAFRTLSLHTGKHFCHPPKPKIITEFQNALPMDALCVQGRDMCWDLPWECTCAQDRWFT